MVKERLIWVDSLKGILMLLVVYGHAIANVRGEAINDLNLWNMMYSFYMPAFMAVSGWLTYRPSATPGKYNVIIKWVRQLIIPYLSWSLIKYLLGGGNTFGGLTQIILKPDSFLWLLWVLFFIRVFFLLAQKLSESLHINENYPIVTVGILLTIIMVLSEFRDLGFQFISYYYLFFILGYFIHKYPQAQIKNKVLLCMMFIIWAILGWFWKVHDLPEWMPTIPFVPSSLVHYLYRGITAFLAIWLIFSVAPKLLNGNNWINDKMAYLGVISLGLYTVHMSFIKYIAELVTHVFPTFPDSINEIMVFALTLTITIIIVRLLQKNIYTNRILLGSVK